MAQWKTAGETVLRDRSIRSDVVDRCPERGHFAGLRLGRTILIGMLGVLAVLGTARPSLALAQRARLRVRPHDMATATRTAGAGEYTLDGKPQPPSNQASVCAIAGSEPPMCYDIATRPMVYVPQPCVGARRCPLVVLSNAPQEYYAHIADKYGMIVALIEGSGDTAKAALFDRGLQTVLRSFAVDPDKIAIMGRCSTGQQTVDYAAANPGVFSRVVVGTTHAGDPPVRAPKQTTEYFIAGGFFDHSAGPEDLWSIRRLRDRGYTVTYSLQFRGHTHTYEEYDYMGRWLQQSWATPDPAARPVPETFADLPLLTADIMARMTAFWTRFMQEPESIKTVARRALVRDVLVPVGTDRFLTLMVDMPALAAKYPSVAAALDAAQLTPQQHEVYRAALASTLAYGHVLSTGSITRRGVVPIDSIRSSLGLTPTSVVETNLAFMEAHPDEFSALEATGMWNTP